MTADDQERKSLDCIKSLQEEGGRRGGEGGEGGDNQIYSAVRAHVKQCIPKWYIQKKLAGAGKQTQSPCFELPVF